VTNEKPREIAVRVLAGSHRGTGFLERRLERALDRAGLASADRRLCQELVYGVVRWQGTLDWLIDRKARRRRTEVGVRVLLRLGLYQLFWTDRIPDHAAVAETVILARRFGFGSQVSFVNAMLRSYAREKAATRQLLEELKLTQPHLGFSHPAWLVERWAARWGMDQTQRLLEWNNRAPVLYARLNTLRTDLQNLLAQWRAEEVEYGLRSWDWTGENLVFELKRHPPLATLASFKQGSFYIQDPSTLLAVHELEAQPGETVLDLCAAPGGKTTYLAQVMENRGRIVARDERPERLKLLKENCTRLGVTCVEIEPALSGEPSLPEAPAFDRILVDAPCSNTGVLRRRVELRWRLRREEIDRLRATQLDLLRRVAASLRSGGTLVYSTCSLEPEENGAVVGEFLLEHPAFRVERERELMPFRDGVDGAYVARLTKSGAV
jgi:16S rRNA (cytosine967-C5)-methyltransferase